MSQPPVRTVLAAFIAHGSREKDVYRKGPFRQLHGVHRGELARSLTTFVPFSRPSPSGPSPCMELSYTQTTMPSLTACRASEASLGSLPSSSPPSFTSLAGSPVFPMEDSNTTREVAHCQRSHPLSAAPQTEQGVKTGSPMHS